MAMATALAPVSTSLATVDATCHSAFPPFSPSRRLSDCGAAFRKWKLLPFLHPPPPPSLRAIPARYRAKQLSPPLSVPSPFAGVITLSDLYEFICNGPLLSKVGIDPDSVLDCFDKWLELGIRLSRQLGFRELFLTDEEKIRIYHYYIPVFLWCQQQLELHRSQFEGDEVPPLVIGITAPQGCGKSTLVFSLDYLFNSVGSPAVAVSIDDFYLTAQNQGKLAADNPGNSLLELRGNAGSHDLKLGTETLEALRGLSCEGKKVKVPRYDKSAHSGRGDRADPRMWSEVDGPLQVLLFEGWMLGFQPVDAVAYKAVDPQLQAVNEKLAAYHSAWDRYIDSWIIIQVSNPDWVYKWRQQAEYGMRLTGRPGMTDEQVKDFVSRYMSAYKAYLPGLYKSGPKGAAPERTLQFSISENRNPIC